MICTTADFIMCASLNVDFVLVSDHTYSHTVLQIDAFERLLDDRVIIINNINSIAE